MRHVTPIVTPVDTTPVKVMDVPEERKIVIKKIMAYNKDASANTIIIKDGANQKLPAIAIGASADLRIGEDETPNVEIEQTLYVALGTAGTNGVDVAFEVDIQ